ncbi:MAG TPA: glycosyl hydrolase family 79 C-terminal domain-containing protein [Solirubrobacteraceae bacterium]|nr:glycosyl hydrolase family 79 C-terminal domain-containing protein [Solirubrobacteraceae bacterium]
MITCARRTLLGLLSAGLLAAGIGTPAASAYPFALSVTRWTVTRPLPDDFLGLALEYGTVPAWEPPHGPPNRILPALLRGLTPVGRPSIRIGGQSTDRSWWPVRGHPQPRGVTQSLGPRWMRSARALLRVTDARLMLGINLEAGSARLARAEADALVAGLGAGNIRALEVGNEPNLYRAIPWYRVQGGRRLGWYAHAGAPVWSRPASWGPRGFLAQFSRIAAGLPRLPLAGPETVPGPWLAAFAGLLGRGSRVRMLSTHAYGLNQCVTDPAAPQYPSVAHLLGLGASRGMYAGLASAVAAAQRHGDGLRIDEMGSVTCNGRRGVSDTFAAALWVMDALFEGDRLGVGGVNLHTYPGSSNGLFDFAYDRATRSWRGVVHPLYDGALMFARAAPPGSRLLRVLSPPQTRLRAWATRGADGRLRLLLINDSTDRTAQVRVRLPRGYRGTAASIERLRAPGAAATTGITIGGRHFGATRTGTPPPPRLRALDPRGAVSTLSVPAASAALLTIAPALDCLERWLALPDPDLGYSCQSVSSIQAIWARSCFPTVSTWWPACSERIRRKFS